MFSIQSATVSQCPAKVFSESKILKCANFEFVVTLPKCFCIYRLKCSKAVSGWAVENLRDTLFNIIMIIIIIVIKFKLCRRSVFWIHPEILLCPVVIHLQIFVKVLHHRVRKVDIFRAEPRDRRRWRDSCFVAS